MKLTEEQQLVYKNNIDNLKPVKVQNSFHLTEYVYYLHDIVIQVLTSIGGDAKDGEFTFFTPEEWIEYKRPWSQQLEEKTKEVQSELRATGLLKPKSGAELISEERLRQVKEEGYTPLLDAAYTKEELLTVACCYIGISLADETCVADIEDIKAVYPWDISSFKPTTPIRNLVKAGALIAAEIDRLQNIKEEKNNETNN